MLPRGVYGTSTQIASYITLLCVKDSVSNPLRHYRSGIMDTGC